MTKRIYAKVALLMAGIAAACVLLTMLTGVRGISSAASRLRIVTTFYPVTVAALNLCDGVEGVEVKSLIGPVAGCLHDYQLSPDNRILLLSADLLIMNGAGAESFLDATLAQMPDLPVIDTSKGIALLSGSHEHEEESGHHADEHDHETDEHDHGAVNEHIWTSPTNYAQQIQTMCDGLCAADPAHADAYRANAAAYRTRIQAVRQTLLDSVAGLPTADCLTFHDSLAYFAQELGLSVCYPLHVGEESGVAASDLTAAEQAAQAAPHGVLLLYDSQYPQQYATLGNASERYTLVLDMAVTGDEDKDAWLNAMEANARQLHALAQKG